MAHQHSCRHCGEQFICADDTAECFRDFIVCNECFWAIEFRHFAVFIGLLIVAVLLTLFVFSHR